MTQLSDYDLSGRCQATVKESHRITPDNAPEVRNIQLSVANPGFRYRMGQSVGVLVPGPHAHGSESHLRLYTVASAPEPAAPGAAQELELCVRRCFYIDEVNGEEYPGVASNHLCDARPGDQITLTGPYGDVFTLPEDPEANLLMIGTGTGIAPFRAFVRYIYEQHREWKGALRLFYGARTGVEKLYQNDERNDFANYYEHESFEAFEGLSHRPWVDGEEGGLGQVLEDNAEAIWKLLQQPKTYVYIAGLSKTLEAFMKVMAKTAGSEARLKWTREEMQEQGRWSELTYG
jgi:ferredoxin--NADP+ reductase